MTCALGHLFLYSYLYLWWIRNEGVFGLLNLFIKSTGCLLVGLSSVGLAVGLLPDWLFRVNVVYCCTVSLKSQHSCFLNVPNWQLLSALIMLKFEQNLIYTPQVNVRVPSLIIHKYKCV